MKTNLISRGKKTTPQGKIESEYLIYACPCKCGRIIEEVNYVNASRKIYIDCKACEDSYAIKDMETSWELVKKVSI